MRVAIYGSGGLGGYYGARLAQAGHDVGFIARSTHLAAIREQGLRILSPLGDLHLPEPLVSDSPADIGEVELVIVAVKTWQVPEVAQAMAPLLGERTLVVPFLNGVEAPDQLVSAIGPERVLGGLSKIFSLIEAPGVIRHLNPGTYIEIGELDGTVSDRVRALVETVQAAGIDAAVSADIRRALWLKLLLVSSWSGLGALARSPIDIMRARPGTRALIGAAMDEGLAIGRAMGHALDDEDAAQLWAFYDSVPAGTTSSMLRDIVDGRPSELEAWNGAIVRFGAQLGVPTPVHGMAYELLLPMERRARGGSGLG